MVGFPAWQRVTVAKRIPRLLPALLMLLGIPIGNFACLQQQCSLFWCQPRTYMAKRSFDILLAAIRADDEPAWQHVDVSCIARGLLHVFLLGLSINCMVPALSRLPSGTCHIVPLEKCVHIRPFGL